jgi:CRISPR-associated endonuclease/helicase Cas3
VFGIKDGDTLPAMKGWLLLERSLDLNMKKIGACGIWSEGTFTIQTPSWIGMVAELLGPELPNDPDAKTVVSEEEPRRLGPFRLAFFEALIRAADVKASRNPGRGKKA